MKPFRLISLIVATALIAAGCTTLKRYKVVVSGETDNTIARIDLFGFRLSESGASETGNSLWDLTADAQSQLIKILNNRYPDNDKFREAMNFRYPADNTVKSNDDYVKKDLRLVFSVSRSHDFFKHSSGGSPLSEADRIEYLKIGLIVPEETPFHFTGWNLFATEYGTIDIADMSFSRTIDLGITAGLTTGKGGDTELTSDGKTSFTREEDQKLKYRYLKLNGRINNNHIEMEEEGTREIDLTGNIIADVSIEFESFTEIITMISGLSDTAGAPAEPEKLSVRFSDVAVPLMEDIKDTVFAELRMDYIYRNVLARERTFPEWDDRIRYISGSVTKKVPVLTSRDYVPGFCSLGAAAEDGTMEFVGIRKNESLSLPLIFKTFSEANLFLDYLFRYKSNKVRSNTIIPGGFPLVFLKKELHVPEIANLSLEVIPYYR